MDVPTGSLRLRSEGDTAAPPIPLPSATESALSTPAPSPNAPLTIAHRLRLALLRLSKLSLGEQDELASGYEDLVRAVAVRPCGRGYTVEVRLAATAPALHMDFAEEVRQVVRAIVGGTRSEVLVTVEVACEAATAAEEELA